MIWIPIIGMPPRRAWKAPACRECSSGELAARSVLGVLPGMRQVTSSDEGDDATAGVQAEAWFRVPIHFKIGGITVQIADSLERTFCVHDVVSLRTSAR